MKMQRILMAIVAVLLLSSCEKVVMEEPETPEEHVNLLLRITGFEQIPFDTRASTDITELCSRISFVLFKDGDKIKELKQKSGDSDFGTAALSLPEGNYRLVVIAHNGEGNATVSSADKITFQNNVVSDTFYYYGEVKVDNNLNSLELVLSRPVSMFRFEITDNMPDNVRKMQFYYTGGSSTFSAESGYGNVNSRQTVKIDVKSEQIGRPTVFEVYTFLHDNDGSLKMKVSAMDGSENVLYEREFTDVPMRRNAITKYTGTFFDGGSSSSDRMFTFKADGDWNSENEYSY